MDAFDYPLSRDLLGNHPSAREEKKLRKSSLKHIIFLYTLALLFLTGCGGTGENSATPSVQNVDDTGSISTTFSEPPTLTLIKTEPTSRSIVKKDNPRELQAQVKFNDVNADLSRLTWMIMTQGGKVVEILTSTAEGNETLSGTEGTLVLKVTSGSWPEGDYTMDAIALDSTGATSYPVSWPFSTVNPSSGSTNSPVVTLASVNPNSGSKVKPGEELNFGVSYSDSDSDISHGILFIRNSNQEILWGLKDDELGAGSGTLTLKKTFPKLPDGDYSLEFHIMDNAGNFSDTLKISYTFSS
ncbi:hypothetical protein ACFL35_11625 [Candidatus Riflebacteria bacterium]